MVNYSERLDRTFAALVEPTRRATLGLGANEDGARPSARWRGPRDQAAGRDGALDRRDDAGLITRTLVGCTGDALGAVRADAGGHYRLCRYETSAGERVSIGWWLLRAQMEGTWSQEDKTMTSLNARRRI